VVWLHGNASAQPGSIPEIDRTLVLHCGETDARFDPGLPDFDVVSIERPGNPGVATGSRFRIGSGTAGQIQVDAAKASGETHITYLVRPRGGNTVITVRVTVEVFCPVYPTPPPTPTHTVARCPACAKEEKDLNDAADDLSAAVAKLRADEKALRDAYDAFSQHTPSYNPGILTDVQSRQDTVNADDADIKRLQASIAALVIALDNCEKKNCTPANPAPNAAPNPGPNNKSQLKNVRDLPSIAPQPGTGAGHGESVFAPPVAGPGSTIVATVIDQDEPGPQEVMVGTVEDNGQHRYFKTVTDTAGRIAMLVPAGVVALELFQHFDPQGNPSAPVRTDVGQPSHLTGTTPLAAPTIPKDGPAILEGNPAIEQGGSGAGTLTLHTRGTDPLTAKVLIDGRAVETYGASDSSIVARVPPDLPLGAHDIAVSSGGAVSNRLHAAVVALQPEPVPLMHVGQLKTLRVRVAGIPAGRQAAMRFEVGGAAKLAAGGTSADVPVVNGIATVKVQAVRAGQLVAHCQLHFTMPEE
jgi:hypothetical protein